MKRIYFMRSAVDSMLSYSKAAHPEEGILLLRGKVRKDAIFVVQVIIPPLATQGKAFSSFPLHLLPIDASVVGVAHSHPSGSVQPSLEDLNNFYGRLMVIIGYPYESEADIGVFNAEGNSARFTVI